MDFVSMNLSSNLTSGRYQYSGCESVLPLSVGRGCMGGLAVIIADVGDGEPDAGYGCVHLPYLPLFLSRVRRVHRSPSDSAVLSIFLGAENQFRPVGAAGRCVCLFFPLFAYKNTPALSAVRRRVMTITQENPYRA